MINWFNSIMTRKETNRFDQISRTIQRNQTVLPFQTFFKQNPNSKDRRETKINSTFFHFRSPQTWNNNLPHGIVYLDKSQNLNPAQEIALIPHVYTHIYHNSMENRSLIKLSKKDLWRTEPTRSGWNRWDRMEKTPWFSRGLEGGPRKNLRIFANACPHWILFVVRKHGPRDGFIVLNAAGSPASQVRAFRLFGE